PNRWGPAMEAYRLTGDTARARMVRDTMVSFLKRQATEQSGVNHAFFYARTGNDDSAFYWLNYAFDKKSAFFFTSGGVPYWPGLKPLQRHPRCELTLYRVNVHTCTDR